MTRSCLAKIPRSIPTCSGTKATAAGMDTPTRSSSAAVAGAGRRYARAASAMAATVGSFCSCPVLVAHQLSALGYGDPGESGTPPGAVFYLIRALLALV